MGLGAAGSAGLPRGGPDPPPDGLELWSRAQSGRKHGLCLLVISGPCLRFSRLHRRNDSSCLSQYLSTNKVFFHSSDHTNHQDSTISSQSLVTSLCS